MFASSQCLFFSYTKHCHATYCPTCFSLFFFPFLRRPIIPSPSPDRYPFSTDTPNTQTPGNRKKGGNKPKHNTGTTQNASRNHEIALKKEEEEGRVSHIYFANPTFARMLLFAALSSNTPKRDFHTTPGSWDASIPFQIPFVL